MWHLADPPGNGSLIGTIPAMTSVPVLLWVLVAFQWDCADLVDPLGLSHCLVFRWGYMRGYKLKILILQQTFNEEIRWKMDFQAALVVFPAGMLIQLLRRAETRSVDNFFFFLVCWNFICKILICCPEGVAILHSNAAWRRNMLTPQVIPW